MSIFTEYILALQHALAMFGSTVLVPYLTGLSTSLALIGAGVGTLLFHQVTKKKVPIFVGSSFAFIASIQYVLSHGSIAEVKGGVIVAGIFHILLALLIGWVGVEKIEKILPPIVIGPIIISIGLKLIPVALSMAGYQGISHINTSALSLALVALVVMIAVSCLQRSFFRFMPIISAIVVSYLLALLLKEVDVRQILSAPWIGFDHKAWEFAKTPPKFSLSAILMIAPISIVTLAEHIGEIKSNSAIVGKDFLKDPGLHRTLLGDGLASVFAGFLGGPAITTYAENTGVLASTKIYNPAILRKAAVLAIIIGLCGKVIAVIQSIPVPIMGGISLVLFGLIASIGIRILATSHVNFNHYRNLVIPAIIIILGVFVDGFSLGGGFVISGLFCATLIGVASNFAIPEPK